jgi:hypothetical protein
LKGGSSASERALSFGEGAGVVLRSDDEAAIAWIEEYFGPTLVAGDEREGLHAVEAGASAPDHEELAAAVPGDAPARPWFTFDQRMLSLPSRSSDAGLIGLDAERSAVLSTGPGATEVVGDPSSRRWRFTLVMALQELIALPLRASRLEVHASAVETDGGAILIVGPKRAGKTTLSFHLLRSGRCRAIANDRVFAGPDSGSIAVRGVPSSLRVGPAMAAEFPELGAGLPPIDRVHLYSAEELARPDGARPPETDELMLSPAQVATQLGVERIAAAPLGALLFPRVDAGVDGWRLDRLDAADAAAETWANRFGIATRPRPATAFEELRGGAADPPWALADRLSEAAPAYRVTLGRGAYDDPDFAVRFLARVAPGP